MNILAFKIEWKFAHFRKFYTTTSPLTFQIPPYTVLRWILAAILWLEKDTYNEDFQSIKIWVKINSDVTNKNMFGLNYTDTRSPISFGDYIQVKQETIVNPSYTIFVWSDDFSNYNELKNLLSTNSWVYTPYLGIAWCLANIEYLWEITDANLIEWKEVEIDSIIPQEFIDWGKNMQINQWEQFEFEKVPYQMDNNRNLIALKEFLFNPQGWKLKMKTINYYQFNKYKILLW